MRALLYTHGSPFARAVRIILHELGLDYARFESDGEIGQRLDFTPTLQVPALKDGSVRLWGSDLVAEYLLETYPDRTQDDPPLARVLWRERSQWHDKLVLSAVQTLGASVTTISQMTWTGVTVGANEHLDLCASRVGFLLDWLEGELVSGSEGFLEGALSAQDIFLASHLGFVQARPLGIELPLARWPKIRTLLERLAARRSFTDTPIWWWDPKVVSYRDDGTPVYAR